MSTAIEERRVVVGDMPTHYLAGGEGPPLVLLHGHGDSSEIWRWVLPALARTHRVYAPDTPGAGNSAKLADYSLPPAFYSDFLAKFLDALGLERAALVGHSHGGNTALRFALAAPDRVSALGLVDSSGLGRVINPALIALTLPGYGDAAVVGLGTPLGAPQWASMLMQLTFVLPPLAPPAWLVYQYGLAQTPGHLQGTVACLRGEIGPWGQREVLLDELPRLEMPTLIVWGANDMILPSYQARDAACRLENGRLVSIPYCGHSPHVERPDRFVAALGRFLADHTDGVGGGGG